ncbi:MAG: hypothetical protein ACK42D_03645 [Candidatus Paceibacteria bacterium]
MNNNQFNQKMHGREVPHINHEPRRVASRMEGVVKNVGIKPVKKQKKGG